MALSDEEQERIRCLEEDVKLLRSQLGGSRDQTAQVLKRLKKKLGRNLTPAETAAVQASETEPIMTATAVEPETEIVEPVPVIPVTTEIPASSETNSEIPPSQQPAASVNAEPTVVQEAAAQTHQHQRRLRKFL